MPKKKKKSKKAAKPKKAASSAPRAPAPQSSSNSKWIVGAIVVVVVLFLLFSGKKAPEAPADDGQAAPVDEAPAAEEEYGGDDEEGRLVPSEVTILSEKTGVRVGAYGKTTWDEKSFFGGIKCLKSTGYRWDVVEFQLTNKEEYPVQLSYAKADALKATPTSFTINGRTLRKGVKEACGGDVVEAGKTVTCKFEEPLRHYGPTGKQSANELQLKIRHDSKKTTSQIQFFC